MSWDYEFFSFAKGQEDLKKKKKKSNKNAVSINLQTNFLLQIC